MNKLNTPFGDISVTVDGQEIEYYPDKERMLIELLRNNYDSHGTINRALHQLAATVLV